MTSRKVLKKEIKKTFDYLYFVLLEFMEEATPEKVAKANELIDKLIEAERDYICRVSVNEGREVKGRVKKYFSLLKEDLNKFIADSVKEIDALGA